MDIGILTASAPCWESDIFFSYELNLACDMNQEPELQEIIMSVESVPPAKGHLTLYWKPKLCSTQSSWLQVPDRYSGVND